MCLTFVTSTERQEVEGVGYKVVIQTKGGYKNLFAQTHDFIEGVWTKCKCYQVSLDSGENYESGFHIFTNELDGLQGLKFYREALWYVLPSHIQLVKVQYKTTFLNYLMFV
jgi:hypothetical protein